MGDLKTSNTLFTNTELLVRSFDRNKNQVMDELQVDERVKGTVDSDKNGQVSSPELIMALRADAVEINQGKIVEGKGMNIFVNGLETLKNVRSVASNSQSWTHVWAPTFSQEDTGAQRYQKLVESNRAYSSSINSMESALRSVRDMTSGATDATSRALNIQAKTTLSSASWRSWVGNFQDMMDSGQINTENIRQMEMANTNLQAAYETLNNTMKSIAEQTKDLPDVQGAAKATDASIARAFSNLNGIKNSSRAPGDVSAKLKTKADEEQAKATGRTGPGAAIGAGIGAVGGGLVGYFALGRTGRGAMIGAGVGTALSAGVGALIGHSIDMKYLGNAQSLRTLADDVTRYQPQPQIDKLENETQNVYGQLLDARGKSDLDNARVTTNNLNSIQSRVKPIETESQRILDAYNMK